MKAFVLASAVAATLALAAVPAGAAAVKHHHRHHHRSQTVRDSYASQPQIACTQIGCLPVPRGCYPAMGHTPDGTPTGFDVAVCGNTTLYGNR